QRAAAVAKAEKLGHGGGRRDQDANLHLENRASLSEAAHVSPRSVAYASKVIDEGAPELVQAMERGGIAASTAAELTALPKPEQKRLIDAGDHKAILAAAADIRKE